ncbi:hypothetical protein [Aureispira sp. CCB-E]|uniref:hypothetical protein n=1 Tax=Aureispira sp. CCB-E TaxID=3051121 RepID=UPI00286865A6|nr:hypothetical protein [Aureispira sp. CCB-E]WMX15629.1 hypothetical protein QP953_04450 [Aureispira sp. CCB-E]
MKAIYLITGTTLLLAIGTAFAAKNNTSCCGQSECVPNCCTNQQDCCKGEGTYCIPNCCK